MKFRKKPVVIEAEQYEPGKLIDGLCPRLYCPEAPYLPCMTQAPPHIHTLEGVHIVRPGDYVITGVKGEKYPCKPDIFEMTYEKVE